MEFVDSHTAGEPTRVIVAGGPTLQGATLAEQVADFRARHDAFRRAVVLEPRGSDVLVGALLTPAVSAGAAAGVIFFNNVGYLGMCGHGMIGVVATLAHLGRIGAGVHAIDTPVGTVTAVLDRAGEVSITNVASYRAASNVAVDVPGMGAVVGDIAWGGNWFFLVNAASVAAIPSLTFANVARLAEFTQRIRIAVNAAGHGEVDHVELFGAPSSADANSTNFVLCPGGAYDRSPCGTGTSAKLACLAADGHLAPGNAWVQQGILGTAFRGQYDWLDRNVGTILPTISGSAFITASGTLHFEERDPFREGIAP